MIIVITLLKLNHRIQMNLLYDEETNRVNALYGHFVGHIVYTIVVIYELICCSIAACCLFSVCVCVRAIHSRCVYLCAFFVSVTRFHWQQFPVFIRSISTNLKYQPHQSHNFIDFFSRRSEFRWLKICYAAFNICIKYCLNVSMKSKVMSTTLESLVCLWQNAFNSMSNNYSIPWYKIYYHFGSNDHFLYSSNTITHTLGVTCEC